MVSQQPLILVSKLYLIIKFRIKAITFTGVLPSGQDNERGEEVDEEEVGEIEYWGEEELGEEWEQWEFVGEDDVEEDQEYEEDEEEEEDEEDDDDEEEEEEEEEEEGKEEENGEGEGASVPTDLCMICVTRPRNASSIHGHTGHQVCCFECASRLKNEKERFPVCRKKKSNL